MARNKYGLGRTIPSNIRRGVRQRCGFGCVLCGLALYDYEHFDPEFKDALRHDELGITLLCPQCNQKKRRGHLSSETVARANANPRCRTDGFASETFDIGVHPIAVEIGGMEFVNVRTLIQINGMSILEVKPPEHLHEPYRLFGLFADEAQQITLRIDDNRWIVGADNWDVECTGATTTVRNGPGRIVLELTAHPPTKICVTRLDMYFEGVWLRAIDSGLNISFDGKCWSSFDDFGLQGMAIGIAIDSRH